MSRFAMQSVAPPILPTPGVERRLVRTAAEVAGETSPLQVGTLVLWLGCLVVGGLGLALHYGRPVAPVKATAPTIAEILHVELSQDPLPPPDLAPPDSAAPPPLLEPLTVPPAPTLTPVAEPSAAVAFALPVAGPTRIVDVKEATHSQSVAPATTVTTAAPPVQALTYGQGEGKQPAPQYPQRARNAGQEGSVLVRFSVGENGRVLAAESPAPSPWPLLNEAALKVVRERWRFRPGPVRLFEVAIRFEL